MLCLFCSNVIDCRVLMGTLTCGDFKPRWIDDWFRYKNINLLHEPLLFTFGNDIKQSALGTFNGTTAFLLPVQSETECEDRKNSRKEISQKPG